MIDLRHAKIKYSNRVTSGENFIQLQCQEETILMAYESVIEFDRWAICFQYQQKVIAEGLRQPLDNQTAQNTSNGGIS